MIVELVALIVIIVLPVSLVLGTLTVIGLGVASLASPGLDEGRLLRGQTH